MWKLFKNLFRNKDQGVYYPKRHELTKDQVRVISSFFRLRINSLGFSPNTPLGEIARVARLHWMTYESLEDKLDNVIKERDRYKFDLDQYRSKCIDLIETLSDLRSESSNYINFNNWLTMECLRLNKEVGFEVTKDELIQMYKNSTSKSEVNNEIQEG